MNRLFRFSHIFVLCCVALFLFGVHTNVGECGLRIPTVSVQGITNCNFYRWWRRRLRCSWSLSHG